MKSASLTVVVCSLTELIQHREQQSKLLLPPLCLIHDPKGKSSISKFMHIQCLASLLRLSTKGTILLMRLLAHITEALRPTAFIYSSGELSDEDRFSSLSEGYFCHSKGITAAHLQLCNYTVVKPLPSL